ncbi:PLP-dependent aminotransferase family protein [Rhodoferax sp. WC2427]|uniref:MocR-like pyridoxine biosynthesis transcription factor PdxR n=1 Tax=Rhodoferax sp. WC2427 TaxID=3234144 RepID=UPI003467E1BA
MTPTSTFPLALFDTPLDKDSTAAPLQRQLHHRLKQAILDNRLAPGSRLPASRGLAEALAISRNTVTAAYEHLAAEGYVLQDRQGTRVAALASASRPARPRVAREPTAPPVTARRLAQIRPTAPPSAPSHALRPGIPALSHFPLAAWRRACDQAIRRAGPAALGYGDPVGEPALRTAIARHLAVARGVRCVPEQIVITEGAQEALALCVRLLSNPGDTAWVEDPGYRGAKVAMQGGDLRILPLRVDGDGLVATEADWKAQPPRLVYTTPSHQYPVGAVLTVARRLALIAQARAQGAWILEDDYDSEYRHAGEPIGAMQGLVAQAPVLYLGTFSKTMFPSLRLGFLVLPEALLEPTRIPLQEMLRGGHRYEQLALADFIASGQFSRHLGRMRRLYRDRQHALREALTQHLGLPHRIEGGHCGLHLTVRLPSAYPDAAIAQASQRYGIAPTALSGFALQPQPQDNGLVLGYGNTSAELFAPLVQRLGALAREAQV